MTKNRLLLFIITMIVSQIIHSQDIIESPYALFGDYTPVLDIPHNKNNNHWAIIILLSDSTYVEISIANNTLTITDSLGDILITQKINPAIHAMFTSIDPKTEEMPETSPYVYCLGNPIRFIDQDGQRPTEYEAALMASAVYKDKKYGALIEKLNEAKWNISSIGSNLQKNHPAQTGIGLQSMVFERKTKSGMEYAYVYAGTNSWEDAVEDISQLVGITAQYSEAIRNAKSIDTEVGSNELTFVGHSLGGGEAAAASMATGRAAITFNPAAVSKATQFIHGLSNSGNIVNYISSTPKVLGIQITVDYITNFQNRMGIFAPGRNEPVSVGFFPSHSINRIIDALCPK